MKTLYPNEPEDGHNHVWEYAEGCDTGTDEDAYICSRCGLLTAFPRDTRFDEAEEDKLADALKVLEQIDFSVCSSLSRLYDKMPWEDMERACGYKRNA
jgi:hypothetical protein